MPVISAGAEAQEAEQGWTSSPAGQTSGQRPQSLPQSGWGSQASELCPRGMEGSGWRAVARGLRGSPSASRCPTLSPALLPRPHQPAFPSHQHPHSWPSQLLSGLCPSQSPRVSSRTRAQASASPCSGLSLACGPAAFPSPITAGTGLLSPRVAEGRCKEGWRCLSRTPLLSPLTTAPAEPGTLPWP